MITRIEQTWSVAERAIASVGDAFLSLSLNPASSISLWSLISAILVGLFWVSKTRKKRLSLRQSARIILPDNHLSNDSAKADWFMLIANHSVFPWMIGGIIVSSAFVSGQCTALLTHISSDPLIPHIPDWLSRLLATIALYIAYEFAYFIDHYLAHHIKWLWHFHKVHHTAEKLTPFTVFRVHPVDSLVYANIAGVCLGAVAALCSWVMGPQANPLTLNGENLIVLAFVFLLVHLQHSHLWLTFPGIWGNMLLSPAAHQMHHSRNPADFNCNYGNTLTIWDRLFGTYRRPPAKSPGLKFGVADLEYNPHSAYGLVVGPAVDLVREHLPAASNDRKLPVPR